MIKLRKVLSGVVAAAVLVANSAIMTSAATTYSQWDVNHDGVINVRDVAAIQSFLKGNILEPNYNRFDANRSLTVDDQDVQCVLAKINYNQNYIQNYICRYYSKKTHNEFNFPNVSGYTPDYTADLTESRNYKRYSYNLHREYSYSLAPANTNTLLPNAASKNGSLRSIVGTDNRYLSTTGDERKGIVRIRYKKDNNTNAYDYGTGFIVDDHVIATSANNVYSNQNGWRNNLQIKTFNVNTGTVSNTTLTPVEAHIPNEYRYNHLDKEKHDFALITVSEDLSSYEYFALGNSYNVKESDYSSIPLHVTGYPVTDASNNNVYFNRLYTGEGHVVDDENTDELFYDCDTVAGNTGSPVYTVTINRINGQLSYTYTALGINGSNTGEYAGYDGSNHGVLITKYLTQFYLNNSNIHY